MINIVLISILVILGLYATLFVNSVLGDFSGNFNFKSSGKAAKKISRILVDFGKNRGILYDLGCSSGGLAIKISRGNPGLKIYGIDKDWLRIFLARAKSLLLNRPVVFMQGDIFSADISKADAIFIYLDQALMPKLQDKLQKEMKPGSVAITNSVSFPNWHPAQIHNIDPEKSKYGKMFVYQKI